MAVSTYVIALARIGKKTAGTESMVVARYLSSSFSYFHLATYHMSFTTSHLSVVVRHTRLTG